MARLLGLGGAEEGRVDERLVVDEGRAHKALPLEAEVPAVAHGLEALARARQGLDDEGLGHAFRDGLPVLPPSAKASMA